MQTKLWTAAVTVDRSVKWKLLLPDLGHFCHMQQANMITAKSQTQLSALQSK